MGECLGNEKEVGNEVGLSDKWVKSLQRKEDVHEVQYQWMCVVQL